MKYSNQLTIRQRAKGIPYAGFGDARPDGEANYGFTNLKGRLDKLDSIPELARDADLRDLVRVINQPNTGLITIGCTSGTVQDDKGRRVGGYVEFAFNSAVRASDAGNYFPVFFHFDRALHESAFDEDMHFVWELEGAIFSDIGSTGFTSSVYLNTGYHAAVDAARRTWAVSLAFLGQYLGSVPSDDGQPLF